MIRSKPATKSGDSNLDDGDSPAASLDDKVYHTRIS